MKVGCRYLHNHAKHDENVPKGYEYAKVPQTQQKLSNVVT